MSNLCTPLVMSLHPQWVRKMLTCKKNMELRRVFPAAAYKGLGSTLEESEQYVKPIYFVKTGTTWGGGTALVKVYAELHNFAYCDLRERFAMFEDHDESQEFRCVEFMRDTAEVRHSGLTWEQAIKYQGDRKGIYLLSLTNIQECNFPLTKLGLTRAPQSFAWAKNFPDDERRNYES